MKAVATKSEILEEQDLKVLIQVLQSRGFTVRREKLARGPSFRVRSGSCEVFGEKVIFLDKALSPSQQLSFAIDYLLERGVTLEESELEKLSAPRRSILTPALALQA